MIDRISQQRARSSAAAVSPSSPVVFLSYAHAESGIALQFREALASCGLHIIIDVEHLKPGEDITDFARRSVRTADATICLVSAASLSSAWVVFEAITTLHKEHANPSARLVACATDKAFLDPEFRLQATRLLDEEVARIDQRVVDYVAKRLDMNELSIERSRLMRMRDSLGDLLARLRNSLTLELAADTIHAIAARVADYIRDLRGQPPSRTDPRDIRARAEELRRNLCEGRTDDALDRTLDYVREFSDDPAHVRKAISVSNTLRRIDTLEKEGRLSFRDAEEQRQPTIVKLLELIDEIELYPQLPVAS